MRALLLSAALLAFPLSHAKPQAIASDPQAVEAPGPAITAPEAKAQGRITGHVICDDTRRPARGALLMITPLPPTAAQKGQAAGKDAIAHVRSDGTYTADHLPPGEYTVIASLPGYLSPVADYLLEGMQGNDPAHLRELLARNGTVVLRGSETGTLDVTLQRGAAISGQVLYSDGTPAPAINLLLEDTNAKASAGPKNEQEEMAQAFARRIFSQGMSTDDQGHFRLAGLKPGTYRLAAVQSLSGAGSESNDPDGMGSAALSLMGVPNPNSLRFYAGDTTHRAAAKTFDLHPGDEVPGIQITLPLDAFHEIRGTLSASDGRTVNQGQITLTDTNDPQFTFHARVASDGTFAFAQIPAGTYTLSTANARITEPAPNSNPNIPEQFRPKVPVSAFADASQSVLVQDHDLENVSIAVSEVPLPKDQPPATQPAADEEP